MLTNLKSLGLKLREYREQLQESVLDLSSATGITQDRLAAMEIGSIRPTGDEILILSDHLTCDFRELLSEKDGTALKDTEILYRRHGEAFSKKDRKAVREFLYLCETEQFLMEELEHRVQSFSFKPTGTFYKTHAEEAAVALRKFFDYEEADRPVVPRNVYADFRSLGVHVFRRKLANSNISGLFISHHGAGRCLLVNYSEDVYRQRFTACHEMAHAIFDADKEVVVSFVRPEKADQLVEIRANRFASCFLLPPSMLKRLPNPESWTKAETLNWANEFRVSCDALGIALEQAGLVNASTSKKIRSYHVPSEAKLDPELSGGLSEKAHNKKKHLLERGLSDSYARLCFDASERGVISSGRLAEALLTDPGELDEIAPLYGRQLHYGD